MRFSSSKSQHIIKLGMLHWLYVYQWLKSRFLDILIQAHHIYPFLEYCVTYILQSIFFSVPENENVGRMPEESLIDETATPTSRFTPERPKQNRRTYKQDLDVQAKKLQVKKLESDIEANQKYSQAMESQHVANLKNQRSQDMLT